MFRRLKQFFCRRAGGEKEHADSVGGTVQGRQFTLDAFFIEMMHKRLKEEKEYLPPTDRSFTLHAFFVELLHKRLQEEKEHQPPSERQYTLDAFFMELLERRLHGGE